MNGIHIVVFSTFQGVSIYIIWVTFNSGDCESSNPVSIWIRVVAIITLVSYGIIAVFIGCIGICACVTACASNTSHTREHKCTRGDAHGDARTPDLQEVVIC